MHGSLLFIHAWRAVVALGSHAPNAKWWASVVDKALLDPTALSYGFVRVQCLVYFFYAVPFHSYVCDRLLRALASYARPPFTPPPSSTATVGLSTAPADIIWTRAMAIGATIIAGGYLQVQV